MIVINTPHNPTGSILSKNDLLELEKIVSNTDIIVLSDEVYEHLIYEDEEHQSVASYPVLADSAIAVFSFGKTFHVTGWKMGYVLAPENYGEIVFYDPRPAPVFSLPSSTKPNSLNAMVNSVSPVEGALVLFPSYLDHSVNEKRKFFRSF